MNKLPQRLSCSLILTILIFGSAARAEAPGPFAQLDPADTKTGYLARLLINETPFPGERAWQSVDSTKTAMLQILWVLQGRIKLIPSGYQQVHIAGVRSDDIIDIITGGGGRRQCEGFYRDGSGRFVTDARVDERIDYLMKIANRGGKPGRFAELLNYAQGLSREYFRAGIKGADLYASLQIVGKVEVTGRAYSWMTDVNDYKPGGNFVRIPDSKGGSLGGNRFFTLRKVPQ